MFKAELCLVNAGMGEFITSTSWTTSRSQISRTRDTAEGAFVNKHGLSNFAHHESRKLKQEARINPSPLG